MKSRLVAKVMVLGRDISLQTGFLCRASEENVSTQLFNTLGVSLGVARNNEKEDTLVAIQLWTLPQVERLSGLTANFMRGHRGVIIVIRFNELESIPSLLKSFQVAESSLIMIAVVRNEEDPEFDPHRIDSIIGEYQLCNTHSFDEIVDKVADRLISRNDSHQPPIITFIDEEDCPIFEATQREVKESICSDSDLAEIQSVLLYQGLRILDESCIVEIAEGTAFISLRTGAISFEPLVCKFCLNTCKRKNNICIIAIDSGWSSKGIEQKALLTTAKAIALAERSIPNHVEMQIQRASYCSRFILDEAIQEEVPVFITLGIKENEYSSTSLLDVARERLNQGKLSISAFNILKKRLDSLKKTLTE